MKITSIKHAEKVLQEYVPNVSKFIGDGMSLDRMWELLNILDNPQDNLKVVHIAGTSGKTSTCYYVASILLNSGQKVGLTVSPHIDIITERLQINGHDMPEETFCEDLSEFLTLIEGKGADPSYFELLIAFAFWSAFKHRVDYLVLETGMGGLYDATNVVNRKDKICGITDIGFDHMHILGNKLSEIAEQKAGIIQNNNEVFMYKQSKEIMDKINDRVSNKMARLQTFNELSLMSETQLKLGGLAEFQKRNWLLAEQICNFVAKRDNFSVMLPDTQNVVVPGRIERIALKDGSTLIFDGAHNQQKMNVFVDSFSRLYPKQKAYILIALKEGKEFEDVLNELLPISNKMIVTTFNTSQDLPAKSQDPEKIAAYAKKIGIEVEVIDNCSNGFSKLLRSESNLKLVTGSFYLIGQVRKGYDL